MARNSIDRTPTPEQLWQRIETWLASNAPNALHCFATGVSANEIEQLESELEITLPDSFKVSLTIHDGCENLGLIPDGFGSFYFLPASRITERRDDWNVVKGFGDFDDCVAVSDPGIANDWWNPGWIPFADNGGGDNLCIDLAPATDGRHGQVIMVRHDDDKRSLLAPSFLAWLEHLAQQLEAGKLDEEELEDL